MTKRIIVWVCFLSVIGLCAYGVSKLHNPWAVAAMPITAVMPQIKPCDAECGK